MLIENPSKLTIAVIACILLMLLIIGIIPNTITKIIQLFAKKKED